MSGRIPGFLSALTVLAWALACGPGLEAMHESTLRFEHCYRLDMDGTIASPHREHCWRDWTETYATGQPLDRVEYARRRTLQLESGDTHLLTISGAARTEERVFEELSSSPDTPMAAPAPTSAHEPPPKTEPAPGSATTSSGSTDLTSRPGDSCAGTCMKTLDDCDRLCSTKQGGCVACEGDYRQCMRRCFE